VQHREQSATLKARDGEAIDRHRNNIKTIDEREQKGLKEFDVKRSGLVGRVQEMVKGKAHFERKREDLQKGFESDRLIEHRKLEALKERQFTAQQEKRLQHARERMDMMKEHKRDREDTVQRQERDQPRLVKERVQAMDRHKADLQHARTQEHTKEQGHGNEIARRA
jgi:hypothetical protein